MKITRHGNASNDRDDNIVAFIKDYSSNLEKEEYFPVPEEPPEKRPDYYLKNSETMVEVKAIVDNDDRTKNNRWARIVENMRDMLAVHSQRANIPGTFLVDTPSDIKFPAHQSKLTKACDDLVNATIRGDMTVTIYNVEFKLNRVGEEGAQIYFSSTSGGSIDSAGTVAKNIEKQITTANIQLAYSTADKPVSRRVLLLINEYIFAATSRDVISGLSYLFDNLINSTNIDEIWLQEGKKEGLKSSLIVDREFLNAYNDKKFIVSDQNIDMFQNWFSALESLSDNHKDLLFSALKIALHDRSAHEVFADAGVRAEMVRLTHWLFAQKRFDDMNWLIGKFLDDPSPDPINYRDEETNLSDAIKKGDDPHQITTVLGHLSWSIKELLRAPGMLVDSLYKLEHILSGPKGTDLYVVQQVLFALHDIAVRAAVLRRLDAESGSSELVDFEKLINGLTVKYSKYPALAQGLVHIYGSYPFVDNKIAEFVLDQLGHAKDVDGLYVRYALFQTNLDADKFQERLKLVIRDADPATEHLKGSIMWHLAKAVRESPAELHKVSPYIELFLQQPYEHEVVAQIELAVRFLAEAGDILSIKWFDSLLDMLINQLLVEPTTAYDIWLSANDVLELCADKDPQNLLAIVQKMVELWDAGAYIGVLPRIFLLYKRVADSKQKLKVKQKMQAWHKHFQDLNPKVDDVEWD